MLCDCFIIFFVFFLKHSFFLQKKLTQSVNVAFFGCKSFEHVRQTYKEAKMQLAEILSG